MAPTKKAPKRRKPRQGRRAPESRKREDNRAQAEDRRRKFKAEIPGRIREALDLLGSGAYAQEKESGIHRGNILAWRGEGAGESPSIPGLDLAAVLAEAASGLSLDWLAGFSGMPQYRSERSKLGALANELYDAVVDHLVSKHEVSREFVADVLHKKPADLYTDLLGLVDKHIAPDLALLARLERDRSLWRNRMRQPTFEELLDGEIERRRSIAETEGTND